MLHLFKWRKRCAGQNIRKRHYGALLTLWSVILIALPAFAHDGHDHGEEEIAVASEALPRVMATSEQFELVGIAESDTLVIYLDQFATNAPVTDADIEVTIGTEVAIAEPGEDGVYVVSSAIFAEPGEHELIFGITTPETADLLIGALDVTAFEVTANTHEDQNVPFWLIGAGLLLAGSLIGWFGARARPMAAGATGALIIAFLALMPFTAQAHGGHDHGAEDAAPLANDHPTRLPDGSVFLPKPTQRLLTIRTEIITPAPAGKSYTLAGQTIPDPNASGVVQATSDGQIIKGRTALPVLGQRVRRGEALAQLIPAISADAGVDLANERAALDQSIALLERRLARLRALEPVVMGEDGASLAAIPEARLSDLETELAALKTRRRNVQQFVAAPSPVKASADGVIARIGFQPGEVVAAGDTLFEIVDPAHVWAETVMYADQGAPRTGEAFSGVNVIMPDGTAYDASLVGESAALINQARLMQFRIQTEGAMPIGAAVTVRLQTAAREEALLVPNEAVVRGASGLDVVWTHANAETFEPIIVDAEPYDGARMRILSILPEDARIVTNGASFLEQVR